MAATLSTGRMPKHMELRFQNAKSPRSLVARAEAKRKKEDPAAVPVLPSPTPSIAFSCQGKDVTRFCEHAGRSGRFVFPAAASPKPEVGRYRPEYSVVMLKAESASFAERAPHEPRKVSQERLGTQDGSVWHTDLASPRMTGFAKFPADMPGHRHGLMALETPRPELRKLAKVQMHESPEYAKEWHTRDSICSSNRRQPIWDFAQLPPRKNPNPAGMVYFQPAMYAVQHESVEAAPRRTVPFSKQVVYSEDGGASTKRRRGKAESMLPDRSLFRSNSAVSPRVLGVKDISKVPGRSDTLFSNTGSSWYTDESDPGFSESLERERSFDAFAASRALNRRTDVAMNMSRSQMGRAGTRPLPGTFELNRECTGWDAKEVPSRARPGKGTLSFHLRTGRSAYDSGPLESPLRKPRQHAAPEFRRTAPGGFTTLASLSCTGRSAP